MEITVKSHALSEAFSITQGIASNRTTRPILQNALVKASADGVSLSATDMEIGVIWQIDGEDCRVVEEGELLLPAGRMAQISRSIEADEITIKSEGKECTVCGGRSVFNVLTEAVDDFPTIPQADGEKAFEIKASVFAEMTRKTIFASARESTRYALNGVHFEVSGGAMEMVATDGRRMALVREKLDKEAEMPAAIIPHKALAHVEKLKGDDEEDIRIVIRERQAFFTTKKGTVVSRLVEGHFPPYQDVVPKGNDKKATISRAGLLSAMRQAAIMTSEDSKSVVMAFAGGELTITGRAPDEGKSEVKLDIEYEGEPLEIRFNPQFLIDALGALGADTIVLEMKEPSSPAAMKDGGGFLYVVMPIHIV
jgi:DNA polymerase-3 subunit beta